jgi:hypothetical protein
MFQAWHKAVTAEADAIHDGAPSQPPLMDAPAGAKPGGAAYN